MDTDKILTIFSKYFESTNSEFGLMLTGSWGSGKTHFIRNKLKPIADSSKKKFLYISAYGLKSSDELQSAIFLAAYPLLKTGKVQAFAALVNAVLKYLKIDIDSLLRVQAAINENVILCVDDLERCDGDAIPGILGILNSLVEHNKAKLILVGDEGKLSQSEKYNSWKEKLIGQTIFYNPSTEDQIELLIESDICKRHISKLSEKELRKIIVGVASSGNCKNLRTLFRAFSLFSDIETVIRDFPYFDETLARKLLMTVLALNIELREDPNSKADLKELFHSKTFSLFFLDGTETAPLSRRFATKYFENDYGSLLNCPEIFDYITEGYLDEKKIQDYFATLLSPNEQNPVSLLIGDFRMLDDASFNLAVKSAVERLQAGEITSADTLQQLSFSLFFFAKKGLISFQPHEIRNIFSEGVGKIALLDGELFTNAQLQSPMVLNYGDEHNAVLTEISALWYKQENIRFEEYKRAVIERLDSDTENFCSELYALNKKMTSRPTFQEHDAFPVFQKIYDLATKSTEANKKITLITRALSSRYKDQTIAERFLSEKPFLTQLANLLEARFLPSEEHKKITINLGNSGSVSSVDIDVDDETKIEKINLSKELILELIDVLRELI